MNWEMSKRIMIIILVMLNIGIKIISINMSSAYKLTEQEKINIKKVLQTNNITLYTSLDIEYKPKKELELQYNNLEKYGNTLKEVFFKDVKVKTVKNEKETLYISDDRILTLKKDVFIYNDSRKKKYIESELNELISSIGDDFKNYKVDIEEIKKGERIIEYREQIDNMIMYGNYIKVNIKDNGDIVIKGENFKVNGEIGEEREIISIDLALITLINEVNRKKGDLINSTDVFIEKIDIVHYNNRNTEENAIENMIINTVPAYRIYVSQFNNPFIINAYTNKLIPL